MLILVWVRRYARCSRSARILRLDRLWREFVRSPEAKKDRPENVFLRAESCSESLVPRHETALGALLRRSDVRTAADSRQRLESARLLLLSRRTRLFAGNACPWRASFQNPTWRETTAASKGELQNVLASHDFSLRIFVDAREVALTVSLRIDGTGGVSLVGNGKKATTIRCATNGTGAALVIGCVTPSDVNSLTAGMEPCRPAHVQLTRLRFVGCGNSAVVVKRDRPLTVRRRRSLEERSWPFRARTSKTPRVLYNFASLSRTCLVRRSPVASPTPM